MITDSHRIMPRACALVCPSARSRPDAVRVDRGDGLRLAVQQDAAAAHPGRDPDRRQPSEVGRELRAEPGLAGAAGVPGLIDHQVGG
jgi:hypothetical protein